jgi:biopolymer transport protein ExbD
MTTSPNDLPEDTGPVLKKRPREIDLDMTPMVDVVFLLLIFFMLTASFAMQKSIEIPPPEMEDEGGHGQSQMLQEVRDDGPSIVVRVAADNTIWVEDEKMPTRQALLGEIRRHQETAPAAHKPTTLVVLADPEALHETVVSVLDVGNALRIPNIQLSTLDDE